MTEGMDAQYEALKRFQRDLIDFDERLRASITELEDCLDGVSPLWQDEMRRKFDQLWGPFRTDILHFARGEGPGYVEFITMKMHQTAKYLNQ